MFPYSFHFSHSSFSTHTQIHTHKYTHTNTHTQIHTRTHIHKYTHTQIHVHTHANTTQHAPSPFHFSKSSSLHWPLHAAGRGSHTSPRTPSSPLHPSRPLSGGVACRTQRLSGVASSHAGGQPSCSRMPHSRADGTILLAPTSKQAFSVQSCLGEPKNMAHIWWSRVAFLSQLCHWSPL